MLWSGHAMLATLFWLAIGAAVWRSTSESHVNKQYFFLIPAAGFVFILAESYVLIQGRFHYSQDVVLAWFVAVLLFTHGAVIKFSDRVAGSVEKRVRRALLGLGGEEGPQGGPDSDIQMGAF